jgi:uncharacterized protein (DUF1778 family)
MKQETIYIRVSTAQKEDMKSKAQEAGVNLTDYIISKVLDLPLIENKAKIYYTPKKKMKVGSK